MPLPRFPTPYTHLLSTSHFAGMIPKLLSQVPRKTLTPTLSTAWMYGLNLCLKSIKMPNVKSLSPSIKMLVRMVIRASKQIWLKTTRFIRISTNCKIFAWIRWEQTKSWVFSRYLWAKIDKKFNGICFDRRFHSQCCTYLFLCRKGKRNEPMDKELPEQSRWQLLRHWFLWKDFNWCYLTNRWTVEYTQYIQ